jgi:hypothetical protein
MTIDFKNYKKSELVETSKLSTDTKKKHIKFSWDYHCKVIDWSCVGEQTFWITECGSFPLLKWSHFDKENGGYVQVHFMVLWIRIRIRNNPNFLAGSESESEKKSSDSDTDSESDSDTVVGWKFLWKSKIKHLKEKNLMFFYWKFVFSDVQVSEHIW